MRLEATLFQIAVLVAAGSSGCGGSTVTDGTPEKDAALGKDVGPDAGEDTGPVTGCGGCNCGSPKVTSGNATPQEACQILSPSTLGGTSPCDTFCANLNGGETAGYFCSVPQDFQNAYNALLDGGAREAGTAEAGAEAGALCPAWSGDVVVNCGFQCVGRRTAGIADPGACVDGEPGALLAERAYLEAVSVHAFARLEQELLAHGAPSHLLRDARRARRDEMRHTAMMGRLARRRGKSPTLPAAPSASPARSLFEIAKENAVEGCVRETYGAVVGLVESRVSADREVRRAMKSIAADECRHASLSWAVAAWLTPRLTNEEREAIEVAVKDAIASLGREGDAQIVELLARQVWSRESPRRATT